MSSRPSMSDDAAADQVQRSLAEATASFDAGHSALCTQQLTAAMALAEAHGQHAALGRLHLLGARNAIAARADEDAACHIAQVHALAHQRGDAELRALAHIAAARLSIALGDLGAATAELDRASHMALAQTDSPLGFEFLDVMVATQASLSQIDAALQTLDRLDAVAAALGQPQKLSHAKANRAGRLLSKGYGLLEAGQREEGRAALELSVTLGQEAAAEAQAAGTHRVALSVLNNLAGALAWLGRREEALDIFARHRALAHQLGQETTLVNAMLGEARIRRDMGQHDAARQLAAEAIELGGRLNADRITAWLHQLLSAMDEAEGRHAQALAHHKQFHELLQRVDAAHAKSHARVLAVRLQTEQAQREAVAEHERAETLRRANQALELRTEVLSREAMQDALTGLANRRRMDEHLASAHAKALADASPTCAALLDVDHFKAINDMHSHAVGDLVLVQLAALMSRHCREGDLAARYGGEEFLISFHRVELVQAGAACERLRAAVEGHDWSVIAPSLRVTVSVGIVNLAGHATLRAGLAAADRLMYEAKRAGRNQVRMAGPPQRGP